MSKKPRLTPQQRARRRFLNSIALTAGVTGISLLGLIPVAAKKLHNRLRPPGALHESDFLAACIKCGQCVQVCPVEAIKLADLTDGFGIGVPYIESRAQACDFSCDGLQCVLACPTGALIHEIDFPSQVDMGIARVVAPNKCLAVLGKGFKGLARGPDFKGKLRYAEIDRWNPIKVADHPYDLELCDLCVRQCPIEIQIIECVRDDERRREKLGLVAKRQPGECPPKHAIELRPVGSDDGVKRMKPVILEGCVGCGVCEMICPVEPAVIVMDSTESREKSRGMRA
ncbi:MAG TPA: 4Fe-4S dicluster domain-containing protein [Chromatiaceae bacterium]|nr:4Fe-4S dicluster domain-containing protein [Chromatiaceae bacterium]